MTRSVRILLSFCAATLMLTPLSAQSQLHRNSGTAANPSISSNGRMVTGKITSITVDDPAMQQDSSVAERRFAVRITLDTVEGTVLGFAPFRDSGEPKIQQAMFDSARMAFENNFTVVLFLENPISTSVNPRATGSTRSHVRVVGIRVQR